MKKILYANPKETIEVSYPNWLDFIMKRVFRHLKVKTTKLENKSQITFVVFDEFANFPKKNKKEIEKILKLK